MLKIVYTRLFATQLKKVLRQGISRVLIEETIDMLAKKDPIPVRYKNHKLKGRYSGFYELHIKPDLLLIYTYQRDYLILELTAIGSHSELF